jgi:hypothetical protein
MESTANSEDRVPLNLVLQILGRLENTIHRTLAVQTPPCRDRHITDTPPDRLPAPGERMRRRRRGGSRPWEDAQLERGIVRVDADGQRAARGEEQGLRRGPLDRRRCH